MGFIFDFLGGIFGYILWFFFDATSNYTVAITLFTIVINIIMFPLAIKRQKSMAMNARTSKKQSEIRKKFANDKQKCNEELAKLYEREGINPMNGCLSTLVLPLVLWGGIFGAITKPLQNTLHIAQDKILAATAMIDEIPELSGKVTKGYEQLQIVRVFPEISDRLTMFAPEELADIREFSSGFDLLGLNLLNRPNAASFSDMLWIIPVLCFLSSALSMYVMQKISGNGDQLQGCSKILPYATFIFTAYIAYTVPGAVGVYWIINALVGVIQNVILNRYYNAFTMNAGEEAARVALLELKEKDVVCVKDPSEVVLLNGGENRSNQKNKKKNKK